MQAPRRVTIAGLMGVILAAAVVLAVVRRLNGYEFLLLAIGGLLAAMLALTPLVVILTVREYRATRGEPGPASDPGSGRGA